MLSGCVCIWNKRHFIWISTVVIATLFHFETQVSRATLWTLDSPFSFKINFVFLQLLIALLRCYHCSIQPLICYHRVIFANLPATHEANYANKDLQVIKDMFPSFTWTVHLYCAIASRNTLSLSRFCFLDLSVIYKVSILPSGPLWPCLCLLHVLGRSSLFSDDVSHCQGWLIWVGKRSQGIDLSHRQLWNVFTEWPRDPQTQVCSSLCKTAPVVTRQTYTGFATRFLYIYEELFQLVNLWLHLKLFLLYIYIEVPVWCLMAESR